MSTFTGPELGALVDAGCIIGAAEWFSLELERQIEGLSEELTEESAYRSWIGGAYLITSVEPAATTAEVSIGSMESLTMICDRLGAGSTIPSPRAGGALRLMAVDILGLPARTARQHLALAAAARNAAAPEEEGEEEGEEEEAAEGDGEAGEGGWLEGRTARRRLARLHEYLTRHPAAVSDVLPFTVRFRKEPPPDCGEDHVRAVNLARRAPKPLPARMGRQVESALERLKQKYPAVDAARIQVYIYIYIYTYIYIYIYIYIYAYIHI